MVGPIEAECRRRLAGIREDSELLIAELGRFRREYPQIAQLFAPDQFTNIYAVRRWATDATAALDAGREIPPPPSQPAEED